MREDQVWLGPNMPPTVWSNRHMVLFRAGPRSDYIPDSSMPADAVPCFGKKDDPAFGEDYYGYSGLSLWP